MNNILTSVISLSSMGLLFGAGLAYASQKFKVEKDPKEEAVLDALPGANCGGCGFPGCAGLASAIAAGKAPANSCPVGGSEVASKVAEIMGISGVSGDPKIVANVICNGTREYAVTKANYQGLLDCRAAAVVMGGPKACSYGCLGLGTCERVCPFDAIHVMSDGIALVDRDKCVACGKCLEACPKSVIAWIPYEQRVWINCNSHDKGKEVKDKCQVGCIGCQICVKSCPENTIVFEDNLARIIYEGCTQCGVCVAKCPTKAIAGPMRETAEKAL